MKLSVIVATRNRAHAIAPCLDSIAAAATHAGAQAEIVVVDNGSTDGTADAIKAWTSTTAATVQSLFQPRTGKSAALNLGIRAARGDLLAFTDDDCRLTTNHIADLLRYDAADTGLTLRGGRVELGDATDLPITIQTNPDRLRWHRSDVTRCAHLGGGVIPGCNMAMRRAVVERVGMFDERLGPGARVPSCEDIDYVYRAFLSGVLVEYVPDMAVVHRHGRKSKDEGLQLIKSYVIGTGAIYAKLLWKHPNFREKFSRRPSPAASLFVENKSQPIDISRQAKLLYAAWGATRYLLHI
jgi:GT2 family glycosyltransferase